MTATLFLGNHGIVTPNRRCSNFRTKSVDSSFGVDPFSHLVPLSRPSERSWYLHRAVDIVDLENFQSFQTSFCVARLLKKLPDISGRGRSGLSERSDGHSLHVATCSKEFSWCCTISIHDAEKLQLLYADIFDHLLSTSLTYVQAFFCLLKTRACTAKANFEIRIWVF